MRGNVHTPLEAICDELGVDRISNWLPFGNQCNTNTGNCVTYIGLPKTNGGILLEDNDEKTNFYKAMASEEL